MEQYDKIIQHYFSRPVARTKELSTGSIHVAFQDGTMSVYSVKDIEEMVDTIIQTAIYESKAVEINWNEYEEGKLNANYLIH